MAQGDPRYGEDAYRAHLTDDRSQNGARALDGYSLDVQKDVSWPGLNGSATVRHKDEHIQAVAEWLRTQAESVKSLPGWLTKGTTVSFGPDTWQEAKNLKEASAMVSSAVTDYITKTLANMTSAAAALDSVRSNHAQAENSNSDNARATNAALGGKGSGAGSASHYTTGGNKDVV
jgi:hypothetical protein